MAKIYTKTGDGGTTGVFGGPRVSKADRRIEAYGEVDELNAVLGLALSWADGSASVVRLLLEVQHDLFGIGAELASPEPERVGTVWSGDERIGALEQAIDACQEGLPELTAFILPGGTTFAAALHLARTVCRRAERRVVAFAETAPHPPAEIVTYLNRLSDLLFVLAREANHAAGRPETTWG